MLRPTFQMSHDRGWRGSCAAGDVTAMVVGSGALLGRIFIGLVQTVAKDSR